MNASAGAPVTASRCPRLPARRISEQTRPTFLKGADAALISSSSLSDDSPPSLSDDEMRWEAIYLERRVRDSRRYEPSPIETEQHERLTRTPAVSQAPDSPRPVRTPARRHGKRSDRPKTELLKVRLTPEERAELEMMAGRTTLSRFVRGLLSEERTPRERGGLGRVT